MGSIPKISLCPPMPLAKEDYSKVDFGMKEVYLLRFSTEEKSSLTCWKKLIF